MNLQTMPGYHTATYVDLNLGLGPAGFRLLRTDAPVAYDGFGTMTVADSSERYVLVPEIHAEWQVQRYLSGLHLAEWSDALDAEQLRQILWEALQHGLKALNPNEEA